MGWYIGVPGAGKTWLARAHSIEHIDRTGWPCIVVDPIGESDVDVGGWESQGFVRVESARDVLRAYVAGCCVVWTPAEMREADAVFAAIGKRGRCVLVVDEAWRFLGSSSTRESPLLALMRTHRHRSVRVLLTAQHVGADVPQAALACAPEFFVFRTTSTTSLKRLAELGIATSRLGSLARGRFVRFSEAMS